MSSKMSPEMARNVLQYVQQSTKVANTAIKRLRGFRQDQQKAAEQRNPLIDRMVEVGAIGAHQKSAAAEKLSTHAGTMELLSNAVGRLGAEKQAAGSRHEGLGHGVDSTYGAGSGGGGSNGTQKRGGFVGSPSSGDGGADRAMKERLGLA